MKSIHDKPVREEDYLVKATFIVKGTEVKDVPCKIYLPERTHEKPYILIRTSNDDVRIMMHSHEASMRAVVTSSDGNESVIIESTQVYFNDSRTKFWGRDVSEHSMQCEPQNLRVVRHLQVCDSDNKTSVVFWLSHNELLMPFLACETSYTGDISYEQITTLKATLFDGTKLVFERHFGTKSDDNGDLVQWSYLVACTELDIPASDIPSLEKRINDIDDYLLIASLAARKQTLCTGFSSRDNRTAASFFRGNTAFPTRKRTSINDRLIYPHDYERFSSTCYSSFCRYENKLALRNAIYSAIQEKDDTIETAFLRAFSGFETLILDFKRWRGIEYVLKENEWGVLKSEIRTFIKESTNTTSEQRACFYEKLDEINRVSLRRAFDKFCEYYSVDLSDLWCVFERDGMPGLVDIRNKLIHGDPFPPNLYDTLVIALQHMRYVLERALVKVLGWKIEDTMVSKNHLGAHYIRQSDLKEKIGRIAEFIRNDSKVVISQFSEQ